MVRLRIEGEVERPLEVDFAALEALPGQIADVGARIPGRRGGAVPLASLLAAAGPSPEARFAMLRSTDGAWSACVALEALEPALLLYELDGAPLPNSYGGPVRLLIPESARCGTADADNCANVKFLGEIEVLRERAADRRSC